MENMKAGLSRVLSVTLDDWTHSQVDAMVDVGGNAAANAIYEAFLPENFQKPGPEASFEKRSDFIRHKYDLQAYLKPSLRIASSFSSSLSSSFQSKSSSNSLGPSLEQKFSSKMQVFDKDTFSADDSMGEAEVDIQPLVSAASILENAGIFGTMQIGKWLATSDNALLRDSIINLIDGQIKQEVSLKLQNVESGELDMELEWVPLNQ